MDSAQNMRRFAAPAIMLATFTLAAFGAGADTKRIEFIPEKGETVDRYDFNDNLFTSSDTIAKKLGADFYTSEKYDAFSCSTNLFVAYGTNGVLQLSNTNPDCTGILAYNGPGMADGVSLLITARCHPKEVVVKGREMAIAWVNGEATNNLGVVKLFGTNFVRHCILLTNVTDRATLLIWPPATTQTGRRIQIDDMAFVHGYEPACVVTNTIPGMMMLIR